MNSVKCLIVLVLIVGGCACGSAYAGTFDDVYNYIKTRATKVVEIYDFDSMQAEQGVGIDVVKDVKGIRGLDIDLLATDDNLDLVDPTVWGGISYGIAPSDNLKLGLGVAGGLSRIEDLKDAGEFKYGAYGYASYKF